MVGPALRAMSVQESGHLSNLMQHVLRVLTSWLVACPGGQSNAFCDTLVATAAVTSNSTSFAPWITDMQNLPADNSARLTDTYAHLLPSCVSSNALDDNPALLQDSQIFPSSAAKTRMVYALGAVKATYPLALPTGSVIIQVDIPHLTVQAPLHLTRLRHILSTIFVEPYLVLNLVTEQPRVSSHACPHSLNIMATPTVWYSCCSPLLTTMLFPEDTDSVHHMLGARGKVSSDLVAAVISPCRIFLLRLECIDKDGDHYGLGPLSGASSGLVAVQPVSACRASTLGLEPTTNFEHFLNLMDAKGTTNYAC